MTKKYTGVICRGSYAFNSQCGTCEKCKDERKALDLNIVKVQQTVQKEEKILDDGNLSQDEIDTLLAGCDDLDGIEDKYEFTLEIKDMINLIRKQFLTDREIVEEVKLKPCPFCGSEAKLFSPTITDLNNNWGIVCQDEDLLCCARILYCSTEEEAIQAWNRRI